MAISSEVKTIPVLDSKLVPSTEFEQRRRKRQAQVTLAQGFAHDTYAKWLTRNGKTFPTVVTMG